MSKQDAPFIQAVSAYLNSLITSAETPPLPAELAGREEFQSLRDAWTAMRERLEQAEKDPLRLAEMAATHLEQLLNAPREPEIPEELAGIESLQTLHYVCTELREHLRRVAVGDMSRDVDHRGYIAGLLKRHAANLRHLTWQVEQVADGDFTQHVDFMGDFSKAFNMMVRQLDESMTKQREAKEALTKLTHSLQNEVEIRTAAVKALQQSESRFKYLADHDPLTGALNRRSFLLIAETAMKRAFESGKPCGIALLDVDLFKKFNDTHGHVAGDAALKHVVKVSTAGLRDSDSMGRYGGEEFIFFFATGRTQGHAVAERIRKALEDNPVPLETGPVPLTASVGLCVIEPEWPQERDSAYMQLAIALADTALYQAKQEGRNRVCLSPPGLNPAELPTEEEATPESATSCVVCPGTKLE